MFLLQASTTALFDSADLKLIAPELILTVCACVALVMDVLLPREQRRVAAYFALASCALAAASVVVLGLSIWPGSSVSGLYFSHPESHYFGVGKVERDQVEDYARRKGWAVEEAERWLSPVLNYEAKPARSAAA